GRGGVEVPVAVVEGLGRVGEDDARALAVVEHVEPAELARRGAHFFFAAFLEAFSGFSIFSLASGGASLRATTGRPHGPRARTRTWRHVAGTDHREMVRWPFLQM